MTATAQAPTASPRRPRAHNLSSFTHQVGPLKLFVDIREGSPDRVPLLVFGGIGAPLSLFDRFVKHLDPDIEVIRVDPPGIGRSYRGTYPYRYTLLAMALDRLLDDLGYEEVDVLGISWGGGLAQQLAWTARKRVRRVVLIGTGPSYPLPIPSLKSAVRLANPKIYQKAGVLGALGGEAYGGAARGYHKGAAYMLRVQTLSTRPLGYMFQMWAGVGWTSLPYLPLLPQRILVLAGRDDPIVRPYNGRLLKLLTRHTELSFYDGGHVDLLMRPQNLLPQIEEFLARD
jgi:pimeloyl-ACP methyl ester carboxylesterase